MWVPYCLPTKLVNLLARSPQMECKQSAKEAANKATNCQNRNSVYIDTNISRGLP